MDIEIIHTKDWPTKEIVDLYKAGGWWKDTYDTSKIPAMVKGSFDFVLAVDRVEKRAVGMGRLVSDGISDGYIQDLVVLPELRGKGIGRLLAEELVTFGRSQGLVWIGLIAEEGTSRFYTRLGFKIFKGEPMVFDMEGEDDRS